MSCWQDSSHLYISWEYTCYAFSVCLCNRWKVYVWIELEYSKYFLLGSCSHWYLLQIYLFHFHIVYLINNKVKSNHLNRQTFNCFFYRINHFMSEFRPYIFKFNCGNFIENLIFINGISNINMSFTVFKWISNIVFKLHIDA